MHVFQEKILKECLKLKSGVISIPMGSGKTYISLTLSMKLANKNEKTLFVVSKSLVYSWEQEIKKWYKDLKYKVIYLNQDFEEGIYFYITTPETLVKYYKLYNINQNYIVESRSNDFANRSINDIFGALTHYFVNKDDPFLENSLEPGFYNTKFSTIVIDEAHNYTNIKTFKCKSIATLCSRNVWMLSGTLFSNIKPENVLGFHQILNIKNFPNNIPDTTKLIKSDSFQGINKYLVHRQTNDMFTDKPKIEKKIITYELNETEKKIYTIYKEILKKTFEKLSVTVNDDLRRHYNADILTLLMVLRITIVAPMIPISKIFMNIIDTDKESSRGLNNLIKNELIKKGINSFLDDEKNLYSSRITKTIDYINSNNEKMIIISSFRLIIDYLIELLPKDRQCFTIRSEYSFKKRKKILEDFENSANGILLMTYSIGSEGLNLQFASKMILLDVWWDQNKSKQAVARIFRFGQTKNVEVILFYGNTYLEKSIFQKHRDKSDLVDELFLGKITKNIKKINMRDLVIFITQEQNDIDDAIKSL